MEWELDNNKPIYIQLVEHLKLKIISGEIKIGSKLETVRALAEGVETEEQFKLLKEVKCDMAQGYLFGKPMPIEEFEHLIVSNLIRG